MDKGAGGRTKRILSWILAALIITGGAIAIGWFAGIALVDLMEPGSKDLAEQMDELNKEAGEAADGAGEPAEAQGTLGQEPQGPQLSLPSIMDEAFEQQEDEGTSPFASPPWANNVSITPIDEAAEGAAEEESGQEPATADANDGPLQQQTLPQAQAPLVYQAAEQASPSEPVTQPGTEAGALQPAQQASQQVMYKVRVGPYTDKGEADEASLKLKEMGLPVLSVKDGTSFYVQVGAFSVWANADLLVQKVKASGFSAKIAN